APNVILTPHIGYVTDENYRSSYPQIVENALGFLDGKPLPVILVTQRALTGEAPIIRPSRDDDVVAIAAIYGHHVLHGLASFEEGPPAIEGISRRRREIVGRGLPYLVAERADGPRGGRVIGYCYASPFRTRSAYRFTLEDSIYIDAAEVGRG